MTIENSQTSEDQIRSIINTRIEAIRRKDAESLSSGYAPDVVMFSFAPPLQYKGANKKATEDWFALYESRIECKTSDVRVTASLEAAFCHYFYRIRGAQVSGNKVDMWVRITLCFRRIEGEWKITHEHRSVPFDMQTFQAQLDLKP
jgi:uncharacterized protein (TIGR02246 family)